MYEELISKIREIQNFSEDSVPLHAPVFRGNERKYVLDAIDSTFVSSVGQYVNRFEDMLAEITGAARAIACANGTCALEMALRLAGTGPGDVVITQPISFVATANAIAHIGAEPIFVDIDSDTLGLSPAALVNFLEEHAELRHGVSRLRETGQKIAACVPMHTFGLPARIDEILDVCEEWNINLVEDAAEALGSRFKGRHCGVFGKVGCLSFNGNKTVTTGGGGAILTNDPDLGNLAKHLTTTAKRPHPYLYFHDQVGWNYRLPNLNAALGCAQLEQLDDFLAVKRKRAAAYAGLFETLDWEFVSEMEGGRSNYWLCAVLTNSLDERNRFLEESNAAGLGCRPVWEPLHNLPMYKNSMRGPLTTSEDISARLVNLPSGVGEGNF